MSVNVSVNVNVNVSDSRAERSESRIHSVHITIATETRSGFIECSHCVIVTEFVDCDCTSLIYIYIYIYIYYESKITIGN